jgi:hypothetical protein
MNDKLENIWKVPAVAYSRYYLEKFGKNKVKPARIDSVPVEIQIEHLTNTNQDYYRKASLLGTIVMVMITHSHSRS